MGHSQSRHLFPRGSDRTARSKSRNTQLDHLPLLVLESVCQHLCWHCLSPYGPARRLSNAEEETRRSGLETLYRLCLVSRAARNVAQPVLFHRFRGIRPAEAAKFVLILQLRPDLALSVRTLQLELRSANEHLVVDLINLVPALRSLELLHAPRGWTFAGLRVGCMPLLELLCVRFFGLGGRAAILRAAPNLKELVVWSANPVMDPDLVASMSTVHSLKLVNCFPTDRWTGYRDFKSLVDLFDKLVSLEMVNAGHVYGYPTPGEVITMVTPRWSSLRHIRLVGYGNDLEHNPSGDIEPISSLAEFPHLETVEVPMVVVYGSGERRTPDRRLSNGFLPQSVRRISLGWFWERDVDLLPVDLLALAEQLKGGCFRDLRQVKLISQTRKQRVTRLPGYDELERTFKSLGVELEVAQGGIYGVPDVL